jgi:hypothetical protein
LTAESKEYDGTQKVPQYGYLLTRRTARPPTADDRDAVLAKYAIIVVARSQHCRQMVDPRRLEQVTM